MSKRVLGMDQILDQLKWFIIFTFINQTINKNSYSIKKEAPRCVECVWLTNSSFPSIHNFGKVRGGRTSLFWSLTLSSAQPYVDMFYLPCILQIIIGRLTNFIINLSWWNPGVAFQTQVSIQKHFNCTLELLELLRA